MAGDGGFRTGNEILGTSAASASTSTIDAEDAAAADGSDDERASPSSPANLMDRALMDRATAAAVPLDDGPEDDRMHAWSLTGGN